MATFNTKFGIYESVWIVDHLNRSVNEATIGTVYISSNELPVYEVYIPGNDAFSVSEDMIFHTKQEAAAKLKEVMLEERELECRNLRRSIEYFESELEKKRNRLKELEDNVEEDQELV